MWTLECGAPATSLSAFSSTWFSLAAGSALEFQNHWDRKTDGWSITFIPYLPKSMVQFETKCRMLSHTNPTPLYLYLTNMYYSSDKCQRFTHVSPLDFELSSMLSRWRSQGSERVCDFSGSQNVCAVVPGLKLPSPESWAQASLCCQFLWEEQIDPVRTPVCFPWGLLGRNLAASWGHQLCWWHPSLCIGKYMDHVPGRIQMAYLKRFW